MTQPVPSSTANLRNLGVRSRETIVPTVSTRETHAPPTREKELDSVGDCVRRCMSRATSFACVFWSDRSIARLKRKKKKDEH